MESSRPASVGVSTGFESKESNCKLWTVPEDSYYLQLGKKKWASSNFYFIFRCVRNAFQSLSILWILAILVVGFIAFQFFPTLWQIHIMSISQKIENEYPLRMKWVKHCLHRIEYLPETHFNLCFPCEGFLKRRGLFPFPAHSSGHQVIHCIWGRASSSTCYVFLSSSPEIHLCPTKAITSWGLSFCFAESASTTAGCYNQQIQSAYGKV